MYVMVLGFFGTPAAFWLISSDPRNTAHPRADFYVYTQ
jgi:hypothetical protein